MCSLCREKLRIHIARSCKKMKTTKTNPWCNKDKQWNPQLTSDARVARIKNQTPFECSNFCKINYVDNVNWLLLRSSKLTFWVLTLCESPLNSHSPIQVMLSTQLMMPNHQVLYYSSDAAPQFLKNLLPIIPLLLVKYRIHYLKSTLH